MQSYDDDLITGASVALLVAPIFLVCLAVAVFLPGAVPKDSATMAFIVHVLVLGGIGLAYFVGSRLFAAAKRSRGNADQKG